MANASTLTSALDDARQAVLYLAQMGVTVLAVHVKPTHPRPCLVVDQLPTDSVSPRCVGGYLVAAFLGVDLYYSTATGVPQTPFTQENYDDTATANR